MPVEFSDFPTMAKLKLRRLYKPLIWLLLPVALLAGRPMVGCTCSDGTYKVTCEKLIGSFLWANSTKNQQASCCPSANTGSCPACHPSAENGCDGVSARNECVCKGIANNLKLTSSTNLEQHQVVSFACFAIPESDCSPARALYDLEGMLRSDLPPPDRVVLFLHLTI
jgi:hypothetical protein